MTTRVRFSTTGVAIGSTRVLLYLYPGSVFWLWIYPGSAERTRVGQTLVIAARCCSRALVAGGRVVNVNVGRMERRCYEIREE